MLFSCTYNPSKNKMPIFGLTLEPGNEVYDNIRQSKICEISKSLQLWDCIPKKCQYLGSKAHIEG